ncbi:MAG: D-glycerate dehydrogenase, partial [Chloroflexota bacterium]
GVIGVGDIGKAVIRRARVFGMKIIATDIIEIDSDFVLEFGVEMTTLDEVLANADYLSLNADLNDTSRHIINAETLKKMKSTSVVINSARGPLIDENALITALHAKRIGGAALDVYEFEPLPQDSPLIQMENVMLAPHNANSSPAAWEKVHWNSIRNLCVGLDIPTDSLDQEKYPSE